MTLLEPEVRGQSSPPRARTGCNPLGSLFRFAALLLLTLAILWGGALLVSRTDGFRALLARRMSSALGSEVTLEGCRLRGNLTFEFRGIEVPHRIPQASLRVERARLVADWPASLTARALVYGRVEAEGIRLGLVETRDGSREPVRLTRLIGIDRWLAEAPASPPSEAPTAPVSEEQATSQALSRSSPDLSVPRLGWVHLNGHRMAMRFQAMNASVFDAEGSPRLDLMELEIGVDPGIEPDPVVPPKPRYRLTGYSRISGGQPQPFRIDVLRNGEEWVLLELEAETRLLFWVKRLLGRENPGSLLLETSR